MGLNPSSTTQQLYDYKQVTWSLWASVSTKIKWNISPELWWSKDTMAEGTQHSKSQGEGSLLPKRAFTLPLYMPIHCWPTFFFFFATERYYIIIDYIPHTVHTQDSFCNWKLVPLNLPHLFLSSHWDQLLEKSKILPRPKWKKKKEYIF